MAKKDEFKLDEVSYSNKTTKDGVVGSFLISGSEVSFIVLVKGWIEMQESLDKGDSVEVKFIKRLYRFLLPEDDNDKN